MSSKLKGKGMDGLISVTLTLAAVTLARHLQEGTARLFRLDRLFACNANIGNVTLWNGCTIQSQTKIRSRAWEIRNRVASQEVFSVKL